MNTILCLAAAVLFSLGTPTSAQGVKSNAHKGNHPFTPDAGVPVPGATVPPPVPPEPPKPAVGTNSQLQIVYPPTDVVTNGVDNLETTLAMRALKDKLGEPKIVAGSLRDEGASTGLPTEVFHLERKNPVEGKDQVESKGSKSGDISTTRLTRFSICLDKSLLRAGKYSGTLWVAAAEDSGAQAVTFKVFVRPTSSWLVGALLIGAGAGLSWFTLFWVSRQRQLAANQVLIVRLGRVVANLSETLKDFAQSGAAPTPTRSLAHLDRIRKDRLPELLHDKELSVLAGVIVPPASSVNVVDEVEGMNRIVQHGFVELLQLWNAPNANHVVLTESFQKMDNLGATPQQLNLLDAEIQKILTPLAVAKALPNGSLPPLPSEDSIVHRVVATSHLLDVLSIITVVVVGIYILIWKNPGFGTVGNYLEAFLWGLGLKIGGDLTKLGPADVRTSFGIKTPI